jgi:hypothetical protein
VDGKCVELAGFDALAAAFSTTGVHAAEIARRRQHRKTVSMHMHGTVGAGAAIAEAV